VTHPACKSQNAAAVGAADLDRLVVKLREIGPCVVAYSGGVDSSVVLAAAAAALGPQNVLAVTASSATTIGQELETARACAAEAGVHHLVIETDELGDPEYAANTPDRCFFCRRHLAVSLNSLARERGLRAVVDGANADDLSDHRPGMRAASEAGVRHPLIEAGLGKEAVRLAARELGLAVWDRPQNACLASRIPYGEPVTAEALRQVAEAEEFLRKLGFRQCRVRHHGAVARVEVELDDVPRAAGAMRERIVGGLRAAGFTYVALDLAGFRSGSMNEVLGEADLNRDWESGGADG